MKAESSRGIPGRLFPFKDHQHLRTGWEQVRGAFMDTLDFGRKAKHLSGQTKKKPLCSDLAVVRLSRLSGLT